ncbi:MAG: hypothetical protein CHACPFDD_01645 [Phycisphaerae bacterium]|nr:hypothetical protein [Phycisphaerae bacterium]
MRRLSLVKGEHTFVFQYPPGAESQIVASFAELAGDPESEFDWYDAAVLSYQMGRQIEAELSAEV